MSSSFELSTSVAFAFLITYLLHSTIWLGVAFGFSRIKTLSAQTKDLTWKFAAIAGLLTTALQQTGITPGIKPVEIPVAHLSRAIMSDKNTVIDPRVVEDPPEIILLDNNVPERPVAQSPLAMRGVARDSLRNGSTTGNTAFKDEEADCVIQSLVSPREVGEPLNIGTKQPSRLHRGMTHYVEIQDPNWFTRVPGAIVQSNANTRVTSPPPIWENGPPQLSNSAVTQEVDNQFRDQETPGVYALTTSTSDGPKMLKLRNGAIAFWILGALVLLIRLARRRSKWLDALGPRPLVTSPSVLMVWEELLDSSAAGTQVRLTCSSLLQSPVAVSLSEICLPTRAIARLSPTELKSVLAHELAHCMRRDPNWLIGLNVIEAIFFFQPMNRLARRRQQEASEYLCDDWAVCKVGDGVPLAKSLAMVASWVKPRSMPSTVATMSCDQGSPLIRRVERILEDNEGPKKMSRTLLSVAAAIALVGGVWTLPSVAAENPTNQSAQQKPLIDLAPSTDELPPLILEPGQSNTPPPFPPLQSVNETNPERLPPPLAVPPVFATSFSSQDNPPQLGIRLADVEPALAAQLGIDGDDVLLIAEIIGAPAKRAGLKPFDVIAKINGKSPATLDALRAALERAAATGTMGLSVLRQGKTREVEVNFGSASSQQVRPRSESPRRSEAPRAQRAERRSRRAPADPIQSERSIEDIGMDFEAAIESIVERFGSAIESRADALEQRVEARADQLEQSIERKADAFEARIEAKAERLEALREAGEITDEQMARELIPDVLDFLGEIAPEITNFIGDVVPEVGHLIGGVAPEIEDMIKELEPVIHEFGPAIQGWLQDVDVDTLIDELDLEDFDLGELKIKLNSFDREGLERTIRDASEHLRGNFDEQKMREQLERAHEQLRGLDQRLRRSNDDERPKKKKKADRVIVYHVKPGDTLASIAGQHFGSPQMWRYIWEFNRENLTSPNQLVVGQTLRIPPLG